MKNLKIFLLIALSFFSFNVASVSADSDSDSVTVNVYTNGACSFPSTHYTCSVGSSVSNVDGASAYTWTCKGTNSGSDASCSEAKDSVTGKCGTSHYDCTTGTSTSNNNNNYDWTWTCSGSGGGTNDSCKETKVCTAPTTQNVEVACDEKNGFAATSGLVKRSQTKNAFPDCSYPSPVTVSNSTYVSDTCRYDGKCSTGHYGCDLGTSSSNVSGTSWTWSCGGTGPSAQSASCSEAKTPSLCTPPTDKNVTISCDDKDGVAATSGVVTRSQTKSAYPDCSYPSTVTVSNSSYVNDNCFYPVPETTCDVSTDTNYNTAATYCSGTCKNGATDYSSCLNIPPKYSSSINIYNCSIPDGASNCQGSVSWDITDPYCYYAPSGVYRDKNGDSQFTYILSAPNGYPATFNYGKNAFYIFCSGKLLGGYETESLCRSGSTWDGFRCMSSDVVSITASNCVIPVGESGCSIPSSWKVPNAPSTNKYFVKSNTVPPVVVSDNNNSSLFALNNNSVSFSYFMVRPGYMNFSLFGGDEVNNYYIMDSNTATASCAPGSTWDEWPGMNQGKYGSCVSNQAPAKPLITGNNTFSQNTLQLFSITGTDPDAGDTIRYGIDWDNNNVADYWSPNSLPYYNSGYTLISEPHSWPDIGTYSFKALTQDINGVNSLWSDLFTVNVTKEPDPAVITKFDTIPANKRKINFEEFITLTWESTGATSCELSSVPGVSVSMGSLTPTTKNTIKFKPIKKTIYTLECFGPGKDDTESLTINVGEIAPNYKEI